MWGPNQGFEPLSKDSIRDPLTNCTILGPIGVVFTGRRVREGVRQAECTDKSRRR